MAPIAFYARVSKKEQSRDTDALVRQLWQLRREAGDRQCLEFIDVQTGKRDDRPEYMKLLALIGARQISQVLITRIDRITRSLEENARLAKLFESTGVAIFELMLGRAIDWRNPNDWSYFVNAGVKAEGESRMLAHRVKQTFEWHREQGKPAGGRVGWPYRRNSTGFIEPDPNEWAKAIAVILIVIEQGGTTALAYRRVRDELGITRSREWLHAWVRSPLLRGHTPRDTRDSRGYKKPKGMPLDLLLNTHPSIFDAHEIVAVGGVAMVDMILADSKRKRGAARARTDYPLSGLLFCGRCGSACHIKRIHNSKYPDKTYTYIMCSARSAELQGCGGEYGTLQGRRRTVGSSYAAAEAAVIEAMKARAAAIIEFTAADHASRSMGDRQESPEVLQLREQILRLEMLGDPDLKEAIAKKQAALSRLLLESSVGGVELDQQMQEMLLLCFRSPDFFETALTQQKKTLYRGLVEGVICDRNDFVVRLRV